MKYSLSLVFFLFFFDGSAQKVYDVRTYGANGDGKTVNTYAIQKAIDDCSAGGGGRVVFSEGVFMSGTIELKSGVELYIDNSAVLKGVSDKEAYRDGAFIYAIRQKHIGILGTGKIDGNGSSVEFHGGDKLNGIEGRPNLVFLKECTEINFKDFYAVNGARWLIKLEKCNQIFVNNIKVISRVIANNDGLDLQDCHNVRVSDSYFDTGDDGICMKSEDVMGVKNVVITNCILKSESNAIKLGTSGIGGFENIVISNCSISDTRLSGIALEMVDGGVLNRVMINNIVMHNVNGAIFIKLGHRKGNNPGILKNVFITDVIADGIGRWIADTSATYYKVSHDQKIGMSITGQPGYFVENVSLNDIYLQFAGGGTKEHAELELTDNPASYPEYTNYGITPAYGINCKYVENITFNNVRIDFVNSEARPALFFEKSIGITISELNAATSKEAGAFMRFKDVANVLIKGCKPMNKSIPFIRFEGLNNNVTLTGNDFSGVKSAFIETGKGNEQEVRSNFNIE